MSGLGALVGASLPAYFVGGVVQSRAETLSICPKTILGGIILSYIDMAGAIEAHDLRTRHAGRLTFLDFHLVVPGSMTVAAAHAICDRIEDKLKSEMGHLMITIHVEPEEKAKLGGAPFRESVKDV